MTLREIVLDAERRHIAVGHFNISDLATLRVIADAAKELGVPVVIGTSEGERDFIDPHDAVSAVRDLRENHGLTVFLNADHTHSVEKAKEAIDAGYDAVLFDGGKLTLEENIRQTKEVVAYARSKNPQILIEGELGYIGGSSQILKEIPKGAAIEEKDLTTPEDAARFVKETGVDLLAPAVGNIHGMFANAPNPHLNIACIKAIREAAKIPLVLHGGSGTPDEDFLKAIDAGISVIHINTEIRVAWRKGLEKSLEKSTDEVAPYKLMADSMEEMKKVVSSRLKLFNRL